MRQRRQCRTFLWVLLILLSISAALVVLLDASRASASTPLILSEASGFPVSAEATGLDTLPITPAHVGDLMILSSNVHSQSISILSVSAPNTGPWSHAFTYVDSTNGIITEEIWWAISTSTTTGNLGVSYSSSVASTAPELVVDSFSPSVPAAFSLVATGGSAGSNTTQFKLPTLISSSTGQNLYWGYLESTTTASYQNAPTGFTYTAVPLGNITAFDATLNPSTSYAPSGSSSPAGNFTGIGAIFESDVLNSISFNSNGGSGTMSAESAPTGQAVTLTTNTFTRSGYTFAGWNSAQNGSGTAYADGASITVSTSLTLYAQWTPVLIPVIHRVIGVIDSGKRTYIQLFGSGLTQMSKVESTGNIQVVAQRSNDHEIRLVVRLRHYQSERFLRLKIVTRGRKTIDVLVRVVER